MENSLDRLDQKILHLLQSNGRISNAELAQQVSLSAPATLRRVRALEERGIIRSYHARLDPARIGLGLAVFISVTTPREGKRRLERFEALVQSWPEVVDAYFVTGSNHYLLKVMVPDLARLSTFITDKLYGAAGVTDTNTSVVLQQIKRSEALPVHAGA